MKDPYRAVHHYPRNDSGRDVVVGDIHGCFARLRVELEARRFDPQRDRLFAVGDLVDRGPESECVLEAVERYGIKSVKGNHEDAIVRWHGGEEQALSPLGNGADWLLDRAEDSEWVNRIATYMASLPYVIEIETEHGLIGIVHADSPMANWSEFVREIEGETADGVTRRKAIWSRTRWKSYQSHPAPSRNTLRGLINRAKLSVRSQMHAAGRIDNVTAVIVGHTPLSAVTAKDNVINIDTGAVYGGKLTIMNLADVPDWIEVTNRPSVRPTEPVESESVRREPERREHVNREPVRREPVLKARRHEPVMGDRPAMAETAVVEETTVIEERPVMTDDTPHLAPESQPAPEPLSSFVSNGMHITVRMSLNSIVNDRNQGANTLSNRRSS
ncbi:serine/threonine protein phosphatase 1 [Paraburkholderia sp. GAS448]|uniref:metallophosphoesterase n=1 Tax=Paraburkholderia sp. GAS448 TaxID=3035136 RepID=UPI003D23712E